jgi:hypothetical protein
MESLINIDETHGAKTIARARRFSIKAVVHYRVLGEERWYAGTVDNMSSTGILFHGKRVINISSSIEVTVHIPGSAAAGHRSKMVSRGMIVRLMRGTIDPQFTMMAAALHHLRLLKD